MFPNTNFIKSNFAILLLLVVCIVALSRYECITSENIEAAMSLLALGICIAFTFAKSIYNNAGRNCDYQQDCLVGGVYNKNH